MTEKLADLTHRIINLAMESIFRKYGFDDDAICTAEKRNEICELVFEGYCKLIEEESK